VTPESMQAVSTPSTSSSGCQGWFLPHDYLIEGRRCRVEGVIRCQPLQSPAPDLHVQFEKRSRVTLFFAIAEIERVTVSQT